MSSQREWLRSGAQMMLLALIQEQDRYGSEIIMELSQRSDQTFEMKEGTLYPILHRLENLGYLKSYEQKGGAGKKRKYYSITQKGKKQLIEDKETWEVFSDSIRKVVAGGYITEFTG